MTLERIVRALYHKWWLLLATVLAASLSSYLITRALPRTYTSRATLMVGQVLQSANPSATDISAARLLANGYADLARREPVLRASLEALGLDWDWTTLRSMVSSRAIQNTTMVELVVKDTDPERARVFVNEITNQLILQSPTGTNPQKEVERQFVVSQMRDLQTGIQKGQQQLRELDNDIAQATSARQIDDARSQQRAIQTQISAWQSTYARLSIVLQEGAPNSLEVMEMAQAPEPVASPVLLNTALAALIGLVLSSGVVLGLEFLDDSLRTTGDVRRVLNLGTLGSVPRIKGSDDSSRLIMVADPRSPTAEAFRVLRTNLLTDPSLRAGRTLMLTSCNPGEGKSLVAANLAIAYAQAGHYVILVDADMRRPVQHRVFQLKNEAGLSSALRGEDVRLEDILQTAPVENLWILTSGPLPDDPSELLGSERLLELVGTLEQHAHIVIFDTPPVMAVGDATVLGPRLDSTLLVIDSGSTRQPAARQCQESLKAAKAHVSGAILNRLATSDGHTYRAYYGESQKRSPQPARPASPSIKLAGPPVARPLPNVPPRSFSGASLSMAMMTEIEQSPTRTLPGPRRAPLAPERKPSPASRRTPMVKAPTIEPAVQRAATSYQAGASSLAPRMAPSDPAPRVQSPSPTPRIQPSGTAPKVQSPSPAPRVQPSSVAAPSPKSGWRDWAAAYLAKQKAWVLALAGIGVGAVLVAVLASSLFQRHASPGQRPPAVTGVTAQATGGKDAAAGAADMTATAAARETVSAQLVTAEAQARAAAATGTVEAAATATQAANNALAAQLALGFLSCDKIDFQVLESPADVTSVTPGDATIALTWRVRNRATSPNCKWGTEGQETRLVRASEVGGQLRTNAPVRLEWIGNDEYYLSLNTVLSKGKYELKWRLLLPKTNLPGGPDLTAKVVVLAPTPTPTPTLTLPAVIPTPVVAPTATVCLTRVYECNCREKCDGRSCKTVCDECTSQECK